VSPFGFGLGTTHFKGDTPFFSSLKIHTIDFTLPMITVAMESPRTSGFGVDATGVHEIEEVLHFVSDHASFF
jgi:hypothetical protein